jgi:hypothetical protein
MQIKIHQIVSDYNEKFDKIATFILYEFPDSLPSYEKDSTVRVLSKAIIFNKPPSDVTYDEVIEAIKKHIKYKNCHILSDKLCEVIGKFIEI